MPAPKKFDTFPIEENLDDSLMPISETIQPNAIKIPHHTNTDHITSLSPPKVAPKFYPHGQDGPKRKITPILTAPAYTSPQRTRRFGKTDNSFIAEVKLNTPKKSAVEIFDSSKMRAPKLVRPVGLLSSKIEEVNLQVAGEGTASKVNKSHSAGLKIMTDASKMSPVKENAEKSTKSANNNQLDAILSLKENLDELKTDMSKLQGAESLVMKHNLPTVSPITEQMSPVSPTSIPQDLQKPLQQQLRMPELTVLDNVPFSKASDNQSDSQPVVVKTLLDNVSWSKEATDNQSASQPVAVKTVLDNVSLSKAPDNQTASKPMLTTSEASGNRNQTIAISVTGPKESRTSGKEDVGSKASITNTNILVSSKKASSKTTQDTSEKQNDEKIPAVSVINVTKPKGMVPKDVGSSSQASDSPAEEIPKEQRSDKDTMEIDQQILKDYENSDRIKVPNGALSQNVKDHKSHKDAMERDQKTLDGQETRSGDQKSEGALDIKQQTSEMTSLKPKDIRIEVPSGTLKENAKDQQSEDAEFKEQQKTSLLIPKDVRRKTSLQIMNTATDKKRRDSVAYLPTRSAPGPTKQRRISLAANPSIPKRRISLQEQLSTKTGVSQFSQKLTNFLKEKGFAYKVEDSLLKLEIPISKISNGAQEIYVVSEASLKDVVRSSKPGVTFVNDPWLDAEFLPLLKTIETGESFKNKTPLTESDPDAQSKDRQKDNEAPPSIENVIKEMNDNPTDYDIQLKNSQILGQYFEEDSMEVIINKKDIIQAILTCIQTFQDKKSLQTVACMSLLKIASLSESNCEILNQCEGLSTLNTIFKCYNDNITVQKLILTIWAYMSASESLYQDMINYGIHTEILETMSRRSDDCNIIKQSCFILANLVNTEETAKQIMLVGGVHTVINVIEKYHQQSDILENGCRALGSFAAFDETCLDVAQAGATKTVVSILHDTIDNVTVQECSLWALACLTSIGETCEEVINMEADEAVLDSLQKYPLEDNIQEYGVRIISNLASIESTSSEISSRRVLEILMTMITKYSHHQCILEHIFVTIGQTVLTFDDQKYLLESGGIRQIISIMEKYNEHPTLLEHGCRIIGNMAVFEKLRSEVESYGASRVVINTMMLLDKVPEIQLCGCMALMNLTANVHTNKLNIMKHGGVAAILSCLDNFTTDSEILLIALKTLTNIISLENVCQSIVEKNGVHLLLSLANTTHLDTEIYTYIAIVLSGLTSLTEIEFDILEDIDTTLITILNLYPNNVEICLAFCQAMENILASELGRRMFIYEDRLSLILKYTTQFIYHSHIQQIGCKIIAILAMDKNNNHVIRPDCVQCLLSISIIHQDNLELQILTHGAISCILESKSEMGRIIEDENGINQIIQSLNRHPTDSRLHVLALMILANLAPTVKKEDSHKLTDTVLKTMAQFTEITEIQSYSCHVLSRLSFSKDSDQVSRVLNSIRDTLKRHSHEGEVVKTASEVLHKISQDGHQEEVNKVLKSPSLPKLPEYFWQSVKSVSTS